MFDNTQELIDVFGIRDNRNYSRITPLENRRVGFSVQRQYPKDILYVPLMNRKGEDDTVAIIHVVYLHPSEAKSEVDSHKVPLIIRIATHSKYRENHIDYDFDDPDSPTRESTERTKATPMPIALDFNDEYFFDHHANTFLDKNHEPKTGEQVLDEVYGIHCDTARSKKARKIRAKLKYQSWATAILSAVVSFFIFILSKVFGRTLDESANSFAHYRGYQKINLKKLSTESLDIFGYKTSRSVIIIFCFIVFLSYGVKYFFGIKTLYLSRIFSESFLALTHSLILLWLLDVVIPLMLFHLINFFIKVRTSVSFSKLSL